MMLSVTPMFVDLNICLLRPLLIELMDCSVGVHGDKTQRRSDKHTERSLKIFNR